jgi:hypothetical protein
LGIALRSVFASSGTQIRADIIQQNFWSKRFSSLIFKSEFLKLGLNTTPDDALETAKRSEVPAQHETASLRLATQQCCSSKKCTEEKAA